MKSLLIIFLILNGAGLLAQAPITYAEWFIDQDPGFGQAIPFSGFGSGTDIQANVQDNLSILPPGLHHWCVRARDNDGRWSQTICRTFYLTLLRTDADAKIEKVTYDYKGQSGQTATYTYTLAQPQHYVSLEFNPEVGDLTGNQVYDLCLTAVRTDGQMSFERCGQFNWQGTVGTKEVSEAGSLSVFPNPSDGRFRLCLPEQRNELAYLSLVDAQGRRVYHQMVGPKEERCIRVELERAAPGIYFAILEMGPSLKIGRVVIQ